MSDPENIRTTRISIAELAKRNGYTDTTDFLCDQTDSVVPACCDEECQVEPDGRCEHGNPSCLLAAGLI
jgi:hypothetical protein